MACSLCGGAGVLVLPVGRGEWGDAYWCDCVAEGDPRRAEHPTRLGADIWRLARPDWQERLAAWLRAREARPTGDLVEGNH